MSEPDWVVLLEFGTLYEAEIALGRLESAGVPARVNQRGAVGIFGPGHSGSSIHGVAILVRHEDLDDARDALDLDEAGEV